MDQQRRFKRNGRSAKMMELARKMLEEKNGRIISLISGETSAQSSFVLPSNNHQPSELPASNVEPQPLSQPEEKEVGQGINSHSIESACFYESTETSAQGCLEPVPTSNSNQPPEAHQTSSAEPQASSQPEGKVVAQGLNFYIIESVGLTRSVLKRVPLPTSERTHTSSQSELDSCGGESDSSYEPSTSDESSSESSEDEAEIPQIQLSQDAVTPQAPTESPAKKPKKRLRKYDEWKRVKAKRLRNSGKSYQSRTGKVVEARKMGPPCSEKCHLQCSVNVLDDLRASLFKNYWAMSSFQRQRDYLNSCVEPIQVKYRRISCKAQNPRKQNCGFYITNNGNRIRVCKKFLINTLGISERALRTVIQGKMSETGVAPTDQRGKHNKHQKTDSEILTSVRCHIQSIPRIESHYVRRDTSREFIDGGLTVSQMHRDYSEERISAQKQPANYDTNWRIFNTEFNIGFFLPKKDQCDICEGYKNASNEQKPELEEQYQSHQEEKALSREEKNMDKEKSKRKEIHTAVYDLQAVLPVPMGQSSAFFYKSRLNCFNFTVTEIGNDNSFCYFWHEGLGNRGVVEIGSCVLLYLEELSNHFPGANVVFYSDNCGGQQKNRFMLASYLYAVQRLNIQTVTHKYLIRGHTQNEGDAVHSIVERSVNRAKKSGPIYVPDQYVSLIRSAKKKGNPLKVREMNFSDFKDLKALYNDMGLVVTKDAGGDNFKLSEVKMLRFSKGSEEFYFKTSYKQPEWSKINIFPKRRHASRKSQEPAELHLKPAYSAKIPISDNKCRDLNSLIQSNIIPPFYKSFYDSLN